MDSTDMELFAGNIPSRNLCMFIDLLSISYRCLQECINVFIGTIQSSNILLVGLFKGTV